MRNLAKDTAVRLIELYQATLSLDHGPLQHLYPHGFCRHHPTCSEFGKQVIQKHGVLRGMPRAIRRVLSCHPWSKPDDEVMRKAIEKNHSS